MTSCSRVRIMSCFSQPGNRRVVILGSKKRCAEGEFPPRVVWLQLQVLLKVRDCVARVTAERGNASHCIVIAGVVRLKSDRFFKRVSCFGYELQVKTDHAKGIMDRCIVGFKVPRVSQISQGTAVVLLFVSN